MQTDRQTCSTQYPLPYSEQSNKHKAVQQIEDTTITSHLGQVFSIEPVASVVQDGIKLCRRKPDAVDSFNVVLE